MLLSNLNLLAAAPGGVARLRELILTLAVQGKLVAQDPKDEPASELLKKIRAEKDRLIAEGKIKRDKPLAEIAEEEKPFALPLGWEWVRFGDAAINRDGERIPVSSSDRDNRAKTYDYYGASGVIDKIDGFLFDKTLLLIGEDGANLINRSTPIAFLAHGKYWVNNHAHVIDTTHPELMTYLALFINAISLEPYVTGTAQPKMNQAKLNSIVIALPPLAEQSRIVTRIEELMRLCDALEAKGQLEATQHAQLVSTLLATLTDSETPAQLTESWHRIATHFDLLLDRPDAVDALEQTILQLAVRGLLVPQDPQDEPASALLKKIRAEKDKLILEGKIKRDKPLPPIAEDEQPFALPQGWNWVRFPDVCAISGGATPSKAVPQNWEGSIPWVSPKDMKVPQIADAQDHVSDAAVRGSLSLIPSGSLLMVVRGMILAHSFPVAETLAPVTINQDMKALTPFEPAVLSFLALLCRGMKPEILALIDRSSHGTCKLESPKIFGMLIPLPPLAEQSRIVTRLAQLRHLCSDLRQRLSASQSTQAHLAEALVSG
jgi:type I restriction enzyme S subunit